MPQHVVEGYGAAVSKERHDRNLAYLEVPYKLLGFSIRDITPLLLCKLLEANSPFVAGYGAEFTKAHVAQFIFILSPPYQRWGLKAWLHYIWCFIRSKSITGQELNAEAIKKIHLGLGLFTVAQCKEEIETFLDKTFLDQPTGGASKSIASFLAWLEYYFVGEPWRWDRSRTLNTPNRILYQQQRCHDKANGEAVANRLSDKVKADWLKEIQKGLDEGKIKVEDLAAFNQRTPKDA